MENILLISKEVLRKDYLSCYGSKVHYTPNIDKLAEKGTIFMNYYATAPSTAMAVTSMFSGLNPYELDRGYYVEVEQFEGQTLFSILESKNCETHVIWSEFHRWMTWRYSKIFDVNTKVHELSDDYFDIGRRGINKKPHKKKSIDNSQGLATIEKYYKTVVQILENSRKPVFIWIHCPHVFRSRDSYGSDIDLFDNLVGKLMDLFEGDIYLTADHGHMGGDKNLFDYGFYAYEGVVSVPLIAPNFFGRKVIEQPISGIQLKNIILENKIYPQKFVYSDTQYYHQPFRRLMIRKGDFKYIYNKKNKSEELYDLKYDPHEDVNLLMNRVIEIHRKTIYYLGEVYYYPRWDEAKQAYFELREEKDRIWKQGSKIMGFLTFCYSFKGNIRRFGLRHVLSAIFKLKKNEGRWGAKVH